MTVPGRVYRSEDGGTTWSESSTGLPNNDDSAHVYIMPKQKNTKELFYWEVIWRENDHNSMNDAFGLYRSEDKKWSELGKNNGCRYRKNIPEIAECNGKIYIATDDGVYDSTDGGQNLECNKAEFG